MIPIKELLQNTKEFDEAIFSKLFTTESFDGKSRIPAILHSDVMRLLSSLQRDFPELISLSSIGQTFEKREIDLMTVDARDYLNKVSNKTDDLREKPAILLTGQHHSREVISAAMVLYSVLKMIHGGILHEDERYFNLLRQNKYYIVPTVNVDGLAYIEAGYRKTGDFPEKRTNMHATSKACSGTIAPGVDLNRNYDFAWDDGDAHIDGGECSELYPGTHPFSEPETRAVRDFLTERKSEVKFVYNFHCAGKLFVVPYNGAIPNILRK